MKTINKKVIKISLQHDDSITNKSTMSPQLKGEQAISGSMPDVEADADLLENAHEVGEQLGEDEEDPEKVDVARDVDQAEEDNKTG